MAEVGAVPAEIVGLSQERAEAKEALGKALDEVCAAFQAFVDAHEAAFVDHIRAHEAAFASEMSAGVVQMLIGERRVAAAPTQARGRD